MIKLKSLAAVSVVFLLSSCGNNSANTLIDTTQKINTFNTDDSSYQDLERINNAIDFSTTTKNTFNNTNVHFYIDGPQVFPALEKMILSAKSSVYVEVFEFHPDSTAKRIADAMVKKAKEGLDVKFLYDFIGNSDTKLMTYMAQNGVEVQTYGKDILSKKVTVTHRKIYLIDGIRAMTGGMNIDARFADGGLFHDILMNYEGEAAKETMTEFFKDWEMAGGKITAKMQSEFGKPIDIVKEQQEQFTLRLATTSPVGKDKKENIYKMMLAAIGSAKKEIRVAMPYFTDDTFINHLISAKNRGVKLTMLIPSKTGLPPVTMANKMTSNQFVKAGVDIYKGGAKDGSFNHSKVITVDGVWSTIGSCNADYRAFHSNQELNIAVSNKGFTEKLNKEFFDRFVGEATKANYENIPWYQKPLYDIVEGLDNLL